MHTIEPSCDAALYSAEDFARQTIPAVVALKCSI